MTPTEILNTQVTSCAGFVINLVKHFFLTNLDVSQNRIWSDIFKAAAGAFAFCFIGINVAHSTRGRIPDELIDTFGLVSLLRKYHILASLYVWLLLSVPFSLSLAMISANPALLLVLIVTTACAALVAISIAIESLPATKFRWLFIAIAVLSAGILIWNLYERMRMTADQLDSRYLIISASWLIFGVLATFLGIYWSDTPNVPLAFGRKIRTWHNTYDTSDEFRVEHEKWKRMHDMYRKIQSTHPRVAYSARKEFEELDKAWTVFEQFPLERDSFSLLELLPLHKALHTIQEKTPILVGILGERLDSAVIKRLLEGEAEQAAGS